jgi:hypothetical protein
MGLFDVSIICKKKIETSLKEAVEGNTITHEDVKKRVLGNVN